MKRRISLRLSPEYGASPIWRTDPLMEDNIDLQSLAVPADLKQTLIEWDKEFQDTYDRETGTESGFKTPADLERHDRIGLEIWKRLREALGSNYTIEFYRYVTQAELAELGIVSNPPEDS